MNFLKNLYYFKKTGIGFTILFFATPVLMTISGSTEMVTAWIGFGVFFLIFYGIPANFFANRLIKKALLENNLGLRLVEEVNRLKTNQYEKWNEKNDAHFDKVKNYVIDKLTKLNESSIDQVKRIDEKIHKLHKKIKEEKSTTNEILKRHPFIKTLKEIQNRSK
jgi:ABC-type lipoprotein release transport system permease subunit